VSRRIGVLQGYRYTGIVQFYCDTSIVLFCRCTGVVQKYNGYIKSTGLHGVHEMYRGTGVQWVQE
jgi:hypothetical protein